MKEINIDKILIFFLPILMVIFQITFRDRLAIYSTFLSLSILVYVLIVYTSRDIYGFSGIFIVSIPSLTVLTFTVFIAIPSIYYCVTENQQSVLPYFISINSFYILYPAGLIVGNFIRKIGIKDIRKLQNSQLNKSEYENLLYELLVMLFIFCLALFLLYLTRTKVLPIFELIKHPGDLGLLATAREKAFKLLDITKVERYLFTWLRSIFLPVGIIGSLFLTVTGKEEKYKFLCAIFLVSGIFINSMTLEKSPIASLFLSIIVFLYMWKHTVSIKFILMSVLLIFSVPFLIALMLHLKNPHAIRVVAITLLYRVFLIPSEVLFQYFNIFPNKHAFLVGQSTQLFSWLFEEGTFPLSNYVAKVWWQTPSTTFLANTNYLGYFWADFGYFGVFIATFLVGVIVHLFYWLLLSASNYEKNFIYMISTSIIVPIFTFVFFSSNFTTLFFTRGLIIIVFILIFVKNRDIIFRKNIHIPKSSTNSMINYK